MIFSRLVRDRVDAEMQAGKQYVLASFDPNVALDAAEFESVEVLQAFQDDAGFNTSDIAMGFLQRRIDEVAKLQDRVRWVEIAPETVGVPLLILIEVPKEFRDRDFADFVEWCFVGSISHRTPWSRHEVRLAHVRRVEDIASLVLKNTRQQEGAYMHLLTSVGAR